MTTLLLVIIYIAFISLGLPDSMLGAAWPVMQAELGLPLAGAGLVSMIVSGCTIISSLFSGFLIRRLGTGKLMLISVLMTALALLGYSYSQTYIWLCLIAVPLGLGAGAVDAALNDFVARNFAARHMSWLHSFWGVGATTGPLIMAFMLKHTGHWQMGYRTIAIIQFVLVAILALSMPLWQRYPAPPTPEATVSSGKKKGIRGMAPNLVAFFAYCAVEASTGLWAASFLVEQRGLSRVLAAGGASAYYLGITLGRFLNGFLSSHFEAKSLIRGGQTMILLGVVLMFLPLPVLSLAGLMIIGLGCAPVYPTLLHETPRRFGAENSASLMGLQMATAYCGLTLMPPLLGLGIGRFGMSLYPLGLMILTLLLAFSTERLNRILAEPTA
ncbi:MAG: MFS transporter [Anaerolineaceae bacterium]|jgi:fucose permease|nr:MFS transporter [Anaerolineaceae bacterium]MDI9530215.1 MFS transporter [Chloroflexota bacterium]HNZ16624.1 MFS transporter [Anaerolineaceae bacterium]HOF27961.1 MFS transporter [Anaerolineaceae bacterium]